MADFPILFTGKEPSYEPRTTGELERAQARSQERLYGERSAEKEWNRKATDMFVKGNTYTDDLDFTPEVSREIAADSISDYNMGLNLAYTENKGILTNDQKREIEREKRILDGRLDKMNAYEAAFQEDNELAKRDLNRNKKMFDHEKHAANVKKYKETGVYDQRLEYVSENPYLYFQDVSRTWKGSTPTSKTASKTVGGETITTDIDIPGTIGEARETVRQHLMSDPNGRLLQGVVEEFMADDEEVKARYLIDGPVDTPEEENAIIRYAQDKYAPLVRRVDKGTKSKEEAVGDRIVDGKGVSSTGKVYFHKDNNVRGTLIGNGKGVKFTDSDPINVMTKDLELPKGVEIVQSSVKAYPMAAANGKVEFRIDPRGIKIQKKTKDFTGLPTDKARAAMAGGQDKDGYYTYEDDLEEGTLGATAIKNVRGDINALYGNDIFNTLMGEDEDPDDIYLEE